MFIFLVSSERCTCDCTQALHFNMPVQLHLLSIPPFFFIILSVSFRLFLDMDSFIYIFFWKTFLPVHIFVCLRYSLPTPDASDGTLSVVTLTSLFKRLVFKLGDQYVTVWPPYINGPLEYLIHQTWNMELVSFEHTYK